MPTFSARLSPKSHFPGPNTGIVFGLFLSIFFKVLSSKARDDPSFPDATFSPYTTTKNAFTFPLQKNSARDVLSTSRIRGDGDRGFCEKDSHSSFSSDIQRLGGHKFLSDN
jgi:hypothetical protein